MVSTYYFIRKGEVKDTFGIAELLVHDSHPLVRKAVGSWVREAGKRNQKRLLEFLDVYSASMPKDTFRYAIEKLPAAVRARYLA